MVEYGGMDEQIWYMDQHLCPELFLDEKKSKNKWLYGWFNKINYFLYTI